MFIAMLPAVLLLASQPNPEKMQAEQLEDLRWELVQLKTELQWKPERVGVDEIPPDTA